MPETTNKCIICGFYNTGSDPDYLHSIMFNIVMSNDMADIESQEKEICDDCLKVILDHSPLQDRIINQAEHYHQMQENENRNRHRLRREEEAYDLPSGFTIGPRIEEDNSPKNWAKT